MSGSKFNIHRYLCCFESLKLWDGKVKVEPDHAVHNLQRLQKDLGLTDEDLTVFTATSDSSAHHSSPFKYATALLLALNNIVTNHDLDSDLKEELISIRQINLISRVLIEAVAFGLTPSLPQTVATQLRLVTPVSDGNINDDLRLLDQVLMVNKIEPILLKKIISSQAGLESVFIQYIFTSLNQLCLTNDDSNQTRVQRLRTLVNRDQYFRYLMLLKGLKGLSNDFATLTHRQLLNELKLSGGFELLCRLLLKTTPDSTSTEWQTYEIIARIVGSKGHNVEFYKAIIDDVMHFLRACVLVKDQEMYIPDCVTSLKQLYVTVSGDIKQQIDERLTGWLKKIETPPETVAGVEILSNLEFYEQLNITFSCFGGLPMAKLPSKILVPHLNSLFRLFCLAETIEHESSKKTIATILTYVLNNRSNDELNSFITLAINFGRDSFSFNRIIMKISPQFSSPSLVVCSNAETPNVDGSKHLVNLIKISSNTILMYNVFVLLLEMLQLDNPCSTTKGDLLDPDDSEQLGELLSSKFFLQYTIIEILQELIMYKPLHNQFIENPEKIIEFIEKVLTQQIQLASKVSMKQTEHTDSHMIILLLTVFNELIDGLKNLEQQSKLKHKIRELKEVTQDVELKAQLGLLLDETTQRVESDFKEALNLCASTEPHIKVNGSMQLMKLINQKDPETAANRFKILAIAMKNLKHVESYAYLNTVRLLVALTNLIEADVVDTLLTEFKNDTFDTDYRLKLGEVIVKVTEALGPLVYKYKSELIDCFLRGCVDPKNEIRASSFSKLGTICKILTYQVHSFFNEALTVIQGALNSDQYLPARRAAVMVLSQLLEGMSNLLDHQEMLLPIYRCLKGVIQMETDEVTRIHAALSLETIKMLVKDFLNPEEIIQREIRVTGVAQENKFEIKYK